MTPMQQHRVSRNRMMRTQQTALFAVLFLFSLSCMAWGNKDAGMRRTHQLDKPDQFSSADYNKEDCASLDSDSDAARTLEDLKQREAELARMLADIRKDKLEALRSKPLTIGIVGFGRFGQFIAQTFTRHAKVVVTSRSDYAETAKEIGVTYVPLSDPATFLEEDLDVILIACSIVSFQPTIKKFAPYIQNYIDKNNGKGPLVVDVLSVKEHPREIMLKELPSNCDILCTHPMFGPDSGKHGWKNLNFVYEKTRIDQVTFHPAGETLSHGSFLDGLGNYHNMDDERESHLESIDRIERFLSIWEEEGCRMVPLSCKAHDEYAANSQFITHLMGRILGAQGLNFTPIDTKGFESVLKLVDSTTSDSFDLFYGLYKYNKNSRETIKNLKAAMDDVVDDLEKLEAQDTGNNMPDAEKELSVERLIAKYSKPLQIREELERRIPDLTIL